MARLRLFGPVADLAGRRADVVPGSTLDEVLGAACARYGEGFARALERCRVWVNGAVAAPAAVLSDDDEVALLPPVSGG